jgi:enoyl-CoA hydratase
MTVEIAKTDDVWTIIHNRPEARNAMDPVSADALVEAFNEFNCSKAKVGVFYGQGGSFCSGWDLKYAQTLGDDSSEELHKLDFPIGSSEPPRGPLGPSRMELSKPLIGAIEGPAVAGGMELALWCDIRIMAEDAYFGVYCRRWGIPLLDGGTVRLPRLIGQGKALEIALTGRKVTAQESYQIGLCEKVVKSGTTRAEAEAMAQEIARFPQEAVLADRRSIIESRGLSIRDGMKLEWMNGLDAHSKEGADGASRFSAGAGRHGNFKNI